MFSVKKAFKQRTIGFYLILASAIIAFVADFIYLIIDHSDRTFSLTGFLCMLFGSLSVVLILFTDFGIMPLITSILYTLGFTFTMYAVLPSLSDVWNNVNFIGGNGILGLVFGIIFLVSTLLAIVSCFMSLRKEEVVILKENS